jgi:hypothetical protein
MAKTAKVSEPNKDKKVEKVTDTTTVTPKKEKKSKLVIPFVVLVVVMMGFVGVLFFTDIEDSLISSLTNDSVQLDSLSSDNSDDESSIDNTEDDEEADDTQTEVSMDEVGEDDDTEVVEEEMVAVENEGWSLYSIPEYGLSFEVPYDFLMDGEGSSMIWTLRRMNYGETDYEHSYKPEVLDEISLVFEAKGDNINYYKGLPPFVTIQIFESGSGLTTETEIAELKASYDDFYAEIFGLTESTWKEGLFDMNFGEQEASCVRMPDMDAHTNYCYVETETYFYSIHFSPFNAVDEIVEIVDSIIIE